VLVIVGAHDRLPIALVAIAAVGLLAEEIVLRGVVQRSLPASRAVAAVITLVVGVVAAQTAEAQAATGRAAIMTLVVLVAGHAVAAAVYASSGRVSAAWLSRVAMLSLATFV
jgi:hypothetical protein